MGWTVFCWIFGIVCIAGPIGCIFWYARAVRIRLKEFNEGKREHDE
jgi:hypothetical protein